MGADRTDAGAERSRHSSAEKVFGLYMLKREKKRKMWNEGL